MKTIAKTKGEKSLNKKLRAMTTPDKYRSYIDGINAWFAKEDPARTLDEECSVFSKNKCSLQDEMDSLVEGDAFGRSMPLYYVENYVMDYYVERGDSPPPLTDIDLNWSSADRMVPSYNLATRLFVTEFDEKDSMDHPILLSLKSEFADYEMYVSGSVFKGIDMPDSDIDVIVRLANMDEPMWQLYEKVISCDGFERDGLNNFPLIQKVDRITMSVLFRGKPVDISFCLGMEFKRSRARDLYWRATLGNMPLMKSYVKRIISHFKMVGVIDSKNGCFNSYSILLVTFGAFLHRKLLHYEQVDGIGMPIFKPVPGASVKCEEIIRTVSSILLMVLNENFGFDPFIGAFFPTTKVSGLKHKYTILDHFGKAADSCARCVQDHQINFLTSVLICKVSGVHYNNEVSVIVSGASFTLEMLKPFSKESKKAKKEAVNELMSKTTKVIMREIDSVVRQIPKLFRCVSVDKEDGKRLVAYGLSERSALENAAMTRGLKPEPMVVGMSAKSTKFLKALMVSRSIKGVSPISYAIRLATPLFMKKNELDIFNGERVTINNLHRIWQSESVEAVEEIVKGYEMKLTLKN